MIPVVLLTVNTSYLLYLLGRKGGAAVRALASHQCGPGQQPITWSLHLPYKPLESTLSDEKLFIEIAFAEYFSRLLSNIQSEQSYDHTSHAESQKRDLNCCQQWRQPAWKSYLMIVLIFYRVKNTRLKPNNKKKKVIHSCDVFKFTCNLDSWLHIISFITNNPVPALDSG